jgi:hypothetical protein
LSFCNTGAETVATTIHRKGSTTGSGFLANLLGEVVEGVMHGAGPCP